MIEKISRVKKLTDEGTEYIIEKWICPICKEGKSTLYIDGEWCHGDSEAGHHYKGVHSEGCVECVLQI